MSYYKHRSSLLSLLIFLKEKCFHFLVFLNLSCLIKDFKTYYSLISKVFQDKMPLHLNKRWRTLKEKQPLTRSPINKKGAGIMQSWPWHLFWAWPEVLNLEAKHWWWGASRNPLRYLQILHKHFSAHTSKELVISEAKNRCFKTSLLKLTATFYSFVSS